MKKYIVFCFSLFVFSPLFLLAQTTTPPTSCFDYYHFGSISADLQANITGTVSGVPVTFKGNVVNNNDYPVVNGTLYAKIFRVPTGGKDVNGPYVVDQFPIKQGIDLPAKGSLPIVYTWKVPSYAISGEYKIATYFISDNKFNLLGLSFTNDIIGNSYSFKVRAEQNTDVELDKNTVTVNGGEYHFAAFPPRISKDEPGVVKANLINTTKEDQVIPITYKIYSWDAQSEENLLDTKTENITVKAGKTQSISYTVTDTNHPVYLVEITSTYKDTKSILNIRFVRQGINQPRINFPAVTSYPLVQGQPNTLFSCFHNAAEDTVKDGKLILSIKDTNNKTLYTTTYEGDITGAMMATKLDFTPKKTLNNFNVVAELYSNNKLVDSANMKYDCQTLDPSSCPKESSIFGDPSNKVATSIISIVVLILIALSAFIMKKKKMWIILFLLITSSMFVVGGREVGAMAWTSSTSSGAVLMNKTLYNNEDADSLDMLSPLVGSWFSLRNPNITIKYNVQATDFDTGGNISSGSNLPVGKKITFHVTHDYSDVTWFGSGSTNDSPYGDWSTNATPPSVISCNVNDFASNSVYIPGSERTFYTPDSEVLNQYYLLRVNPPTKSLINIDGLTCGSPIDSGDNKSWDINCVVNKTGPLSGGVNFASTIGKYYGRLGLWGPWYPTTDGDPATTESMCSTISDRNKPDGQKLCCVGNNNPLTHYDYNTSRTTYGTVTPFILQVPTQTIPFTFNGVPATHPPTAPVITPNTNLTPTLVSIDTNSSSGYTGIDNYFNVVSTDQDGDKIKYLVDWDNDGTPDTITDPVTDSGVPVSVSKKWSDSGITIFVFKVKAEDSSGATSGWTTHTLILCSSGYKYCSTTTNACIANSSCCGTGTGGTCPGSQTCQLNGVYGICGDPTPQCTRPAITPTVTPSFVAKPSDSCRLKWNVNSSNSNIGGDGLCTVGIKCYVDNADQTSASSTGVLIPVGTHSLVCGSSFGTSTASVKCKVAPGFGEF